MGVIGSVNVMVQNSEGISNLVSYTYTNTPAIPSISSITPSNGNVGTPVTIYGSGFFGAFYINNNLNNFSSNNNNFGTGANIFQNVVISLIINGQTINYQSNNGSYNYIVVNNGQIDILNLPYNLPGTYDIIVNTLYGSTPVSVVDQFTYIAQSLMITDVTPDTGSSDGGEVITISGIGFDRYNNVINIPNYNGNNPNGLSVMFGNLPASFIVVGRNIVATLPSNIFRRKNIKIVVASIYNNTTTFNFQYIDTLPIIKKITPSEAHEGDIITIKGKNFTNIKSVFFGTSEAQIISIEGTKKIRVIAPKNNLGIVNVVINRTNIHINSPLISNNSNGSNPVLLSFDIDKYIVFSSKIHPKCEFIYC